MAPTAPHKGMVPTPNKAMVPTAPNKRPQQDVPPLSEPAGREAMAPMPPHKRPCLAPPRDADAPAHAPTAPSPAVAAAARLAPAPPPAAQSVPPGALPPSGGAHVSLEPFANGSSAVGMAPGGTCQPTVPAPQGMAEVAQVARGGVAPLARNLNVGNGRGTPNGSKVKARRMLGDVPPLTLEDDAGDM
ncbi:hypothetical protein T484DRAFT_1928505 [Baffinella frigidus]|nr:hypothetical protein T484DRAFT_1928505 [Cryptophyta sp. CCMP2293]